MRCSAGNQDAVAVVVDTANVIDTVIALVIGNDTVIVIALVIGNDTVAVIDAVDGARNDTVAVIDAVDGARHRDRSRYFAEPAEPAAT